MSGHELAMSLRIAYLAMHRRTDAALAAVGVTADQFVVLAALSEGDALTQRALVSRTSSDPNTLRAMLVLLEDRQLVERRPHPRDGRARSVSLTRHGRRAFEKAWQQSEALRKEMLGALSGQGVASLVRQLRRLADTLQPVQNALPEKRSSVKVAARS